MKFVHVPYRGAAPALTDLLGGQVQVFAADAAGADVAASRAARSGRSAQRPASATRCCRTCRRWPNKAIPIPSSDNWYGLLAPAKTPPAIIAKLNDAFVKAINDPAVKKKLIHSGAIPVADTPAEFGKFFKAEYERWGKVVRETRHQGRTLRLSGPCRIRAGTRRLWDPAAASARRVAFGIVHAHRLDRGRVRR